MTSLPQLSGVTATHTRTQRCRTPCGTHRCPRIFWKLHDEAHGEEQRESAVSATRGTRLETQVEVQSSDLDPGERGSGDGIEGLQTPPRPDPALGSVRGTLTSPLTSLEVLWTPRCSNAAQTFSVPWPWQGA